MATIKSYTDINQSKKLAEILPIESADLCYIADSELINIHEPFYKKIDKEDIPCWSLSALLKLIKSEIYGKTIYGDTITYKVDFRKYKFTDDVDLYQIAYGSIKFDVDGQSSFTDMVNTGQKEEPIDAAFQMVVWLKENGKI